MQQPCLAIKIDVDTDRGTRIGVPNLLNLLKSLYIPATFLFSLGPDNTGRAIKRIFRPGFLSKVRRTNVIATYGLRTLLNGVLLPGPLIGKRHATLLRQVRDAGHEVGIHCYDHIRWQDNLHRMTQAEVFAEFEKAKQEFERIFQTAALTAGAAGWQANAFSLAAYDAAALHYASDARGKQAFFPFCKNQVFNTLQIPTTLPTLDELLGLPEFPLSQLINYYHSLLSTQLPNVLTIHAEIEGMAMLSWFKEFLQHSIAKNINFVTLNTLANQLLENVSSIPICELTMGTIPGRSGILALQGMPLERNFQ